MPNKGLVTSVKDWIAHPFNEEMSVGKWLLFLGLVIIAAHMWSTVLRTLKGDLL